MFKKNLGIVFIALLVSGCSTPFVYDHPGVVSIADHNSSIAALSSVKDDRGSKEIDRIYEEDPIHDINMILKEELMSTGLFKEVISLENEEAQNNQESDVLVMPTLLKMDWEVPNYDQILATSFFVGFFTGAVGGVIYGCTGTDVYGDTILNIKTIDQKSGKILIEKTYDGHCEHEKTKFTCDTLTTKATMVGESLEIAIDKFKTDLIKELTEQKTDPVLSSNSPDSADLPLEMDQAITNGGERTLYENPDINGGDDENQTETAY